MRLAQISSPTAERLDTHAQAVRMSPQSAVAHAEYSQALHRAGQIENAIHHARMAASLAPADTEIAAALAMMLEADRQSDRAWEIVDRLLAGGVQNEPLAILFAHMAPHRNCQAQALKLLHRVLRERKTRPPIQQSSLHFAAAQLLDQLGRYDEAFEQASRANEVRGLQFDATSSERLVRDFSAYFSRARVQQMPRASSSSELPVFIVGMPRSGTTLVEQILCSHPSVHGAGELDWVNRLWTMAVQRFSTPTAPLSECLNRLTSQDADALAAEYLEPLAGLNPSAARITDKMHNNYMNLGLIQILFPGARVIHCRRDPLDTCLSCFMTDFATGNFSSAKLAWSGRAWRLSEKIMSHWKSVLDLPILDLEYEHLVQDLEGEARRMIQFIGLPWDDRCIRFHENRRYVNTASNAQVRQPIYQSSVGRWRHYAKHLEPLRVELG